ncbi:MAG: DMT family transporter [Alphaproteobacteria bacterium]|nr:MAG: DMT family transporter [Alphaproteobacteria bacterium]TAF41066.1 MAG: DMT family transporter [Alphaproteobacteria bacterium]TAF76320.1 MAG: DMT family transporter [Alphaproteobacteria bacterium]
MTTQKSSIFLSDEVKRASKNRMHGIVLFLFAGLLSTFINGEMRYLGQTHGYHPFQLVFLYSILGAVCYLPSVMRHPQLVQPQRIKLLALRSFLEVVAFTAVFFAVTLLPFAMFTTLTFTSPLIGAVMAVYWLGERMTKPKIIGLIMGFIGIIIVSNPSSEGMNWAIFLPLFAAVCFSGCGVLIRKLAATEHSSCIAVCTLLGMAILSLPLALTHWQSITWEHAPYIALLAVMVGVVQFCVGHALGKIELTLAQPLIFLNLITSSLLGWLIFDETVTSNIWLGAFCIIAGIIYSLRRKIS